MLTFEEKNNLLKSTKENLRQINSRGANQLMPGICCKGQLGRGDIRMNPESEETAGGESAHD